MPKEKEQEENIYWYGEVTSTMDAAARLLAEGKTGFAIAEKQTAGRGRYGRRWESPEGGLYLSWFGPVCGLAAEAFTQIAALAAVDTLAALGIENCRIKFPNDIMVSGRKIAGILVENKSDAVIVGIGMNLNNTVQAVGPDAVSGRDVSPKPFSMKQAATLLTVNLHATIAAYRRDAAIHIRRWSSLLIAPVRNAA